MTPEELKQIEERSTRVPKPPGWSTRSDCRDLLAEVRRLADEKAGALALVEDFRKAPAKAQAEHSQGINDLVKGVVAKERYEIISLIRGQVPRRWLNAQEALLKTVEAILDRFKK
jgi:hypothetical protein